MSRVSSNRRRAAAPAADNLWDRLRRLAMNLWWTWNPDAQALFASLDPALWNACQHNPLALLARLSDSQRAWLLSDDTLRVRLEQCEAALGEYLASPTWFSETATPAQRKMRVAYFCAEFALHESFAQYAGGLGVLAGDHLKSASDLGVPLVAVGMLYRCGYYQQRIRPDGTTGVYYPEYDFAELPVTDTGKTIVLPMPDGKLTAKIWRAEIGRTRAYLLDTDLPANTPAQRAITRHLYGGDNETRIQQEILLGCGGMFALDAAGETPTVLHLNEGHAAFAALEALRRELKRKAGAKQATPAAQWNRAVDRVRGKTVFTTHTPVPAGHDRFSAEQMDRYFADGPAALGISREELLALGRERPGDPTDSFCMTVLALRLAGHCNGVSKLNGDVARRMWRHLFDAKGNIPSKPLSNPVGEKTADPKRVPIGHVTNGVHSETWLAPELRPLYDKYLKPAWVGAGPGDDWWRTAGRIPAGELWAARRMLRERLVHYIRRRMVEQLTRRGAGSAEIAAAWEAFSADALTIGFARRFATYKRAPLVFSDPKRLSAILNNPKRPVQLVFSGKAHPADREGQAFAQRIHEFSQQPAFAGRVVLIENYDMETGRMLTSGCDVWLNNPLRPREASGTSGMKPPLHGGLNCSILDGWWPEAFDGVNGWAIDDGKSEESGPKVDQRDAQAIYRLLEREIAPDFYARDKSGVPQRWVKRMVASMKTVCGAFSTARMVGEYAMNYYLPAHGR